jgi:unspecific monooxygenase
LPLVQTYRYLRNPLPLLEECFKRFGDIFTLRLAGGGPWVFVSSPQLLKTLFRAQPDVLYAGEANRRLFAGLAGNGSVLTMDESPHRERRTLLLPRFHGDRMHVYFDQIRAITTAAIDRWRPGQPFALHDETQQIALETMMRIVFGVDPDPHDDVERALVHALTDFAHRAVRSSLLLVPPLQRDLGPWSPWGRVMDIVRRADAAIQAAIVQRRARADIRDRQDILSVLLQARREDGTPLTDRELRDELVVMLMVGHESTGTAIAWALERILSLPDVEDRLRAELAAVVGGEPLSAAHLPRLEYLDAAVKESLRIRLFLPASAPRLVQRPFEIGGYLIPPGTGMLACMYLLHRREDLYPDPETFRPERFLKKPSIDPFEFTPFGGGVRRCLGMAFALFEMKTVIATMMSAHARLRILNPHAQFAYRGFYILPQGGPRVTFGV